MHIKTLAAVAALALGMAACGGSDDDQVARATTKAKPVAEIPALTGKATSVTLDAGFV
jgi:hypothetical protein